MNPVGKAIKTVNGVLKMVGEDPIQMPTTGSNKERLEAILDLYTEKLIATNPKYKHIENKRNIPDLVVNKN